MGMLDGILDNLPQGTAAASSGPAERSPLLHLALMVLQQSGGVGGLVSRLSQGGLGAAGQSWVGTGPNQPVDADALTRILGHGELGTLAQSLGINTQDAAGGLAKVLPDLVDRLTPRGHVADDTSDIVGQLLSALQRKGG